MGGADQSAVTVIEGLAAQAQIALRDQFATLLLQQADGCQQVALAGDAPGSVLDLCGGKIDRAGCAEQTTAVVQTIAHIGQALFAADHTLFAVIQLRDIQVQLLVGLDHTAPVVDRVAAHGQRVFTDDFAVAVEQRAGLQIKGAFGRDVTFVAVVEGATDARRQAAIADHRTGLAVIQTRGFEIDQTPRTKNAITVVQRPAQVDVQAQITEHLPATVVEHAAVDVDVLRAERAALIVQNLRCVDPQVAAGGEVFAAVVDGLCAQAQITAVVTAAVCVDASFNGAGVGQLPTGAEHHAVAGGQGLAVGQVALGLYVERCAGVNRSLRVEAGSFDVDRAGGRGVGQAQLPVRIELNIAAAGDQFAVEFHPDAGLGADQFDRPGVHAAECRGVDGQLRFGVAVVGAGRGVEAVGVDVVATGDDGQVLCLDLRIDLGAAGDDFEAVDIGCVDARAFDSHAALIDLKAIQPTVFQHWFTGSQRHPRCVDETAAIAGDAVGVGDDDPRRLPGYFGVTAQLTRVAADDFVENRLRRTAVFQVRVADDVPAQLRVRGLG